MWRIGYLYNFSFHFLNLFHVYKKSDNHIIGVTISEYSGPPDPLHGNTPYIMVRQAAHELSQVLFDVTTQDSEIPEPQPTHMKSVGKPPIRYTVHSFNLR